MGRSDGSGSARGALARGEDSSPPSQQRLRAACLRALADADALGCAPAAGPAVELDAAVAATVRALGDQLRTGAHAERVDLLLRLTALGAAVRERELRDRIEAVASVQDGLERLRAHELPQRLLAAVAAEACRSCGLTRCAVSKVEGAQWAIEQAHFVGDAAGTEQYLRRVRGKRVRLAQTAAESEMIRRRTSIIVHCSDADPLPQGRRPLTPDNTRSYVGAPIVVRDRAIGFLHADHGEFGPEVTAVDRLTLHAFSEGFGELYERAVLLERLGAQHDQIRQMASTTATIMEEIADAEIELAHGARRDGGVAQTAAAMFVAPEMRIESLLTRREFEVLRLMAAGATNPAVAERLVISEATVKSHVKHILRKLRAANRAEAVARYLHSHRDTHHAPGGP